MFLEKTFRKIFIKDESFDLFWFIFGLVLLFTFALLTMPRWIFCLGIGVLTSSVFRYITTDALFYNEFQNLNTRSNKLKYILSKNLFTFLFLSAFVLLIYFILNIGLKFGLIEANDFEFKMVFNIIIYILSIENIILIFNHKMIPSYKSGSKKNYSEDIEVGQKNLKSMIPSLIINIILVILIYTYKVNLNIFAGMCYLFMSMAVFSFNNRFNLQ